MRSFEIEYKYLKAVIEGGLETKPDNVLIYATSNRRHLIKESFDDVKDYKPELHSSDTVQEKLSLVARFGVTIYYGAPEKQEYDDIVINLAKRWHRNGHRRAFVRGRQMGIKSWRQKRKVCTAVYYLSAWTKGIKKNSKAIERT